MFKNLKIFVSNNKKIINHNFNSKKFILIADRQRYDSCIRQSLISKIFNEKGFVPILATRRPNSDFCKVYKSFGIEKKFNTNLLDNKIFIFKNFIQFFFKSIFVLIKYFFLGFDEFKTKFKIDNVYIGPQVLDQYFRNNQSYMKGFITLKFFMLLITSYYKVKLIKNFIIKHNIRYTVVSSDTYLNESSIIYKISQELRIVNIRSVRKTITICKNFKDYDQHLYSIKKKDIEKREFTYQKTQRYLNDRFKGKIDHLDVKNAFRRKIKKFDKKKLIKFFNLKNKKYDRIILFAPHVFADSCSTWGEFPFLNYYNFFTETINHMKDKKNIIWIIKPHPTRHFWNEDNVIKNFLRNNKNNNIFLCPDKISTKDLLKHVDTVVTGRGTIGVESAVFGKRALTCGSSLYRSLNISYNTKTKKDFFQKLNFKNYKFKLKKKDILIAKKALFYMGSYRWKQESNIIPNMATNYQNIEFYFKKINLNLKKYKFEKDPYFLKLNNLLKPIIK